MQRCTLSRVVIFPVNLCPMFSPWLSDEFCSEFECPKDYSLVDYADTTVCADTGCTKDLCCDKDCEPEI